MKKSPITYNYSIIIYTVLPMIISIQNNIFASKREFWGFYKFLKGYKVIKKNPLGKLPIWEGQIPHI